MRILQQARAWLRRRRQVATDSLPELAPLGGRVGERFAFVTSAYNTPPDLLRELAASLAAQNEEGAVWVLVDNGTTDEASRACLDELAQLGWVQLVREPENRGILGGMRAALSAADREFVLPVDSDDLLAPHTIRALGHALRATPTAKFLFSDEDHFTDGRRVNPFYRTGWDPALALACSYIWHLCAFDRAEALRLGVYADPGANYCHDWDTLLRFVRAGHQPKHVAEVLYSWRTHAASTTNNDEAAHSGSLDSQRHVLALQLRGLGLADRFEVADCPLWRGAPELRLTRQSQPEPQVEIAADATALRALVAGDVASGDTPASDAAVLLRDARVAIAEEDALLECVGWLELLPEAAVVGGRLIDRAGTVISAGYFPAEGGRLAAPDAGRRKDDPGYLAMALKPRVVAAVPVGHVLLRRRWLVTLADRLSQAPADGAQFVIWLCEQARASGARVVCTPFVTGSTDSAEVLATGPDAFAVDGEFSLRGVWHGAWNAS